MDSREGEIMLSNYGMGDWVMDAARSIGSSEWAQFNSAVGDLTTTATSVISNAQNFVKDEKDFARLHFETLSRFGPPMNLPSIVAFMPISHLNKNLEVWAKKMIATREIFWALYHSLADMVTALSRVGGTGERQEASRLKSSQIAIKGGIDAITSALDSYKPSEQLFEEFMAIWKGEAQARGTSIRPSDSGDSAYWDALQAAAKVYSNISLPVVPSLGGGMGIAATTAALLIKFGMVVVIAGALVATLHQLDSIFNAGYKVALQIQENAGKQLDIDKAALAQVNNEVNLGLITPEQGEVKKAKIRQESDTRLAKIHEEGKKALDAANEGGVLSELQKLLLPLGVLVVGGVALTKLKV